MFFSLFVYRNPSSNTNVNISDVISVEVTNEMQQNCKRRPTVSFVVDVCRTFSGSRTCEGYNLRVTDPTVSTLIGVAGVT